MGSSLELVAHRATWVALGKGVPLLAAVEGGHREAARAISREGDPPEVLKELVQLGRLEAALATLEGDGYDELRDDITNALEHFLGSLDKGYSELKSSIDEGFARLEKQLGDISVKSGWTEGYKRFVALKRNTLELARRREYPRAVEQGLAALAVDEGGVADDNVLRDAELNALLAGILVGGLSSVPAMTAAQPTIRLLARRAFDKGRGSKDDGDLQAAAHAAHILAMAAREDDEHARGAALDDDSYLLEVKDDVAGLARALAGRVLTAPSDEVARAVALACIVHPRFASRWLAEPALAADPARSDAVLRAVRHLLLDQLATAHVALDGQEQRWRELLKPIVGVPPGPTARRIPVDNTSPLVVLAASLRAGCRAAADCDARHLGWLSTEVQDLLLRARNATGVAAGDLEVATDGRRLAGARLRGQLHAGLLSMPRLASLLPVVAVGSWLAVAAVEYLLPAHSHWAIKDALIQAVGPSLGLDAAALVAWLLARHGARRRLTTLDAEILALEARHGADNDGIHELLERLEKISQPIAWIDVRGYLDRHRPDGALALTPSTSVELPVDDIATFGDHLDATARWWLTPTHPDRVAEHEPIVAAHALLARKLRTRRTAR